VERPKDRGSVWITGTDDPETDLALCDTRNDSVRCAAEGHRVAPDSGGLARAS
jgi:hypothetical protein